MRILARIFTLLFSNLGFSRKSGEYSQFSDHASPYPINEEDKNNMSLYSDHESTYTRLRRDIKEFFSWLWIWLMTLGGRL